MKDSLNTLFHLLWLILIKLIHGKRGHPMHPQEVDNRCWALFIIDFIVMLAYLGTLRGRSSRSARRGRGRTTPPARAANVTAARGSITRGGARGRGRPRGSSLAVWQCPFCLSEFSSRRKLLDHKKLHSQEERATAKESAKPRCQICNRLFDIFSEHDKHTYSCFLVCLMNISKHL